MLSYLKPFKLFYDLTFQDVTHSIVKSKLLYLLLTME